MSANRTNKGKSFYFKNNGYGVVKDEVRAPFRGWSAVIQILEFTDNEHKKDHLQLRFGYLDADGKMIARPLYLDESQLAQLGEFASKNSEVKKMLKPFCDALK